MEKNVKKVFLYVEQTEGGMDVRVITDIYQLHGLAGWMNEQCLANDMALVKWSETAEIGDVQYHRLGIAIRIKDTTM